MTESDFEGVLRSDCFVDKTLLIREFLEMKWRIILLTAPRRFGKTVNMQTIKTFLEISQGSTSELSPNCMIFKNNNLLIYLNDKRFFYENCGRYPVLHVSFKEITGSTFHAIFNGFKGTVRESFLQHKYLLKSSRIDEFEKDDIVLHVTKMAEKSEYDIQSGLKFLTKMLYTHFNKKVIVLIDEYDAPIWQLLLRSFSRKEIEDSIYFIRSIISTLLKDNPYIDRALINACVRLTGVLSSDANNIEHFPFLGQHSLTQYYGLTAEEVKEKLNAFNISEMYDMVNDYYGGYIAEGSDSNIYSTWSILKFLENEVLEDYWVDTAAFENLDKLFLQQVKLREKLIQLLDRTNVKLKTTPKVSIADILTLKDVIKANTTCDEIQSEKFLQFLLNNGYFVSMSTSSHEVFLKIPNEEIHQHLFHTVHSKLYFDKYCDFDNTKTRAFATALNLLGKGPDQTTPLIELCNSISDLYSNKSMPNCEQAFRSAIYYIIYNSENLFSSTMMEVTGIIKKYAIKGEDVYMLAKKRNIRKKVRKRKTSKRRKKLIKTSDGVVRGIISEKRRKHKKNKGRKSGTKIRADVMTVRLDDGAGIIIETKRDWKTAEEALLQIVNTTAPYYRLFDSEDYKSKVKQKRIFIGLHMNTKKGAITACYLVNETNMKSKICV